MKALADATRLRIVALLRSEGELCGCEIETILNVQQSNASRHLHRLCESGLLIRSKRAQWVYYRPDEELFARYPFLDGILAALPQEDERVQRDRDAYRDYRAGGYSCTTIEQWDARRGASERMER
jgi:ArsR family transcriptional regulator